MKRKRIKTKGVKVFSSKKRYADCSNNPVSMPDGTLLCENFKFKRRSTLEFRPNIFRD